MKTISQQVRVFISSTFVDMQKERDILIQDVFPVIKGLCNKLGVVFNMIDLRWGITEEDKAESKVFELCLDEIQQCKPYFIGLIGNRYGTILEDYNRDLEEKYGFIKENRGKSITEIEMILGALNEKNRERCFFYYKDPQMFNNDTYDNHDKEIEALKTKIDKLGIYHNHYNNFDSFKEQVQKDLENAILEDYPEEVDCIELQQRVYMHLQESMYVERDLWEKQVAEVIAIAEQRHTALLAVTNAPAGKTTTFNHIVNKIEDADKIIINFESDIKMRYFPAHYLYRMIRKGLHNYGYDFKDFEEFPEPTVLNNYESFNLSMLSILKKALFTIEYKRPLYILINDVNLFLASDKSRTFSKNIFFDIQKLPDNLYVIMTSNEVPEIILPDSQILSIRMNEAITVEFAKTFFVTYLSKFGKRIDGDILNNASRSLHFCEYRLIADFLISYCNYSSYREISKELLSKQNNLDILLFIYNYFISTMNDKCAGVFTEILLRVFFYKPGISEETLFASYKKETAIEITEYQVFEDLTDIDRSVIMRGLRYFCNTRSGIIYISSPYVESFIGNKIEHLLYVLYKNNSGRTRKVFEDSFSRLGLVTHIVQGNQLMEKDEFLNNVADKNGLKKIVMYAIFDPLCIVLDKTITEYSKVISEDDKAFIANELTDFEINVLMSVQETANLYQINTRTDLYAKILSNVDLMLFICSKSHALIKRLISDFIDLNIYIHKRQFSHVDKRSIAVTVNYVLEPIINADVEKYSEKLISDIANIAVTVLEDYEMTFYQRLKLGEIGCRLHVLGDYIVTACTEKDENKIFEIDYMCDCAEIEELPQILPMLTEKFDKVSNIFDKLLYAYYIIKVADRLLEEDRLTTEFFEDNLTCFEEIMTLRTYCFFPEITEFIDNFFEQI